jgi:hypothetical protein
MRSKKEKAGLLPTSKALVVKPTEANFTRAFILYAHGDSLTQVAEQLEIPYDELVALSVRDRWHLLAKRDGAFLALDGALPEAEREMRVEANRAKNLSVLSDLQEDIASLVCKLKTDELEVARITPAGITVKGKANLKDRVDLVGYIKTVQELSYRALGDVVQAGNAAASNNGIPNGTVTIVLPSVVSRPRGERTTIEINAGSPPPMTSAKTIDLDP